MSLVRRSVTIAALAFALSGPALSADAASVTWKTLVPFDGAKVQACRVPTSATGPWKIKLRVDARKATGKVEARAQVMNGKKPSKQMWESGWVQKKTVSPVGSVLLPRGPGHSLIASADNGQAGNGDEFKAGQIDHC